MLVIPNYPSKCDIISDVPLILFTKMTKPGTSASGTSPDVLCWESQEPFSSAASNSAAELKTAQRLAVGSLKKLRLGREEIQEIAAENGFDQKNCHSTKPGIELNIGTGGLLQEEENYSKCDKQKLGKYGIKLYLTKLCLTV